jgi:trans-aconitate 2-methyltransferase
MGSWDPVRYLRFSDERSRPFFDLVSRIGASAPTIVVDVGSGPGHLTAPLADRWPGARIVGIDSSPTMIAKAREHASSRVQFLLADLRSWRPAEPVDVILSNAALQWVPDHRSLLPRFLKFLGEDGWLAFQVPANFDEPSHRLLRELALEPRFATATRNVEWPAAAEPIDYVSDLAALGCRVEAWETTYLHILPGSDPVFDWISGTGARPVLDALVGGERAAFVSEYKARLREAYPAESYGTVLPFRRIFVVAQLTGAGS